MALSDEAYSRTIAILKIGLPLVALIMLSTIFLFAKEIISIADIDLPFKDPEGENRVREQRISQPFFVGGLENGSTVTFSARSGRPDLSGQKTALIDDATIEILEPSGYSVTFDAKKMDFDEAAKLVEMLHGVAISTSDGYLINTAKMTAITDRVEFVAPEKVTAFGPMGRFEAGAMRIFAPQPEQKLQMVFTGGINLVYLPKR